MMYGFPSTDDLLEYGEYSISSVYPSGNTCQILVFESLSRSINSKQFLFNSPIPVLLGNDVG